MPVKLPPALITAFTADDTKMSRQMPPYKTARATGSTFLFFLPSSPCRIKRTKLVKVLLRNPLDAYISAVAV